MPIYPYKCEACKVSLELTHSIKDAPKVKCPQCGKNTLKREIGQTSFQLSGGGWASHGYK